jgi:hypothetical protein
VSVAINIATVTAIERVITVLQTNLPQAILTLQTDLGLEALKMPAPALDAYSPTTTIERSDQARRNHPAYVWVYQTGPSTPVAGPTSNLMNAPSVHGQKRALGVGVSLVFGVALQEPFTRIQKTLNSRDVMAYRAFLYASAIETVVRQFACCGQAAILDVAIDSDFAGAVTYQPDGEPIEGTSTVTFKLLQETLITRC